MCEGGGEGGGMAVCIKVSKNSADTMLQTVPTMHLKFLKDSNNEIVASDVL